MRSSFFFPAAIAALLALAACGGGSKTTTTTSATNHIAIAPGVTSIIPGQVLTFTANEQDSSNTALTKQPAITFTAGTGLTLSTPNCSILGLTGCQVAACAGTFDSTFINCTPGAAPVQVAVTASADNLSASASVFVHQKVTSVVVSPSSTAGCVSSGGTQSFTATAFNNGTDITSTVGPFSWISTVTSVVGIDNNGLATAASPGVASILAGAAGVSSLPATFNTCAVKTINLHVSGSSATTFTNTYPTTSQNVLVADVIDANGKAITAGGITFSAIPAGVGSFTSGSFNPAGPGYSSIVASCQPPACNIGLGFDTFSNPVQATVTGTTTGSVWVASTAGAALVSINAATNVVGTSIKLPASPNSLIVGSGQRNAYLGSVNGLIVVALASSTVTSTIGSAPGKVLAVDPTETRAIVSNGSNVFIVSLAGAQAQTLNIAGATAAAWTPDGFDAYIVAGSSVTEYSANVSPKHFNLSSAAGDVAFLPSGQFAYFASSPIDVRRPCDNLQADTVPSPAGGTPQLIKPLLNSAAMIAVDSDGSNTGVDVVTPAISQRTSCGEAVTDTAAFHSFSAGVFTPTQLVTSPDSNFAFVFGAGSVMAYNVASGTASSIPLVGGATPIVGDTTLDATALYVGATDGSVHQLTISNGTITDAAQIAVSSVVGGNPDLVSFVER